MQYVSEKQSKPHREYIPETNENFEDEQRATLTGFHLHRRDDERKFRERPFFRALINDGEPFGVEEIFRSIGGVAIDENLCRNELSRDLLLLSFLVAPTVSPDSARTVTFSVEHNG